MCCVPRKRGVFVFLLVLAGLPNICNILRESHESSLRLFEEFELTTLSQKEVNKVALKGIEEYNEKYPNNKLTIESKALKSIFLFHLKKPPSLKVVMGKWFYH